MIKTDETFWRQFGTILGLLVVFGFVVAFIARSIAGDAFDKHVNSPSAVAQRIAPAGSVRVGDPAQVIAAAPVAVAAPAAGASAASDGQSIYSGLCQACHMAGVAGAPKLDDAQAWAPRIALGEDALVASVVNGKGAMPPKAGNPALTEAQIRAAVAYMVGKTPGGPQTAVDSVKDTAAAVTAGAQAAAAAVGSAASAAADKARAMASDAADKAKQMASAATTQAPATVAPAAPAPAPVAAGKPGNEVYNSVCVVCHVTGVANAPKLEDKAAWEPRAVTGVAALVQSVLKGKGAMPPKGGAMTLGEADIENAVRYMLEQAGVSAAN